MARKGITASTVNKFDLQEYEKSLQDAQEKYLPGVSVNIVVFNYNNGNLQILIMHLADTQYFMLPGGYVFKDEDLDNAALRVFNEWTGLQQVCLEQFYTSGKADRTSDHLIRDIIKKNGFITSDPWFDQRKVTVCYFALLHEPDIKLDKVDFLVNDYKWIGVPDIPPLLFDHNHIISRAIKTVQENMDHIIVTRSLFSKEFTMGELQKFYEAVFQKSFTRTNFQRRMLNLDILDRTGKHYSGKAHKAPYLYRFRKRSPT